MVSSANLSVCIMLASMMQAAAFVSKPSGLVVRSARPRTAGHNMINPDMFSNPDIWGSTLSTAVDIFDGSGIDPVVVSNVFWSRLQGSFISFLIGQFLAAIAFAAIMSVASSQLSKLGSFVTENIFGGNQNPNGGRAANTAFKRA